MRSYNVDLVKKLKILLQSNDNDKAWFKAEMESLKQRLKQKNLQCLTKKEQQLQEALENNQKLCKQLKEEKLKNNHQLTMSNERIFSHNLLIKNLMEALKHTVNLLENIQNVDFGR